MSYIENIRVFVRAVEVGNLSAAGRDLRVSPAVASNRIKDLETHLGIRLFNRTTRQLNLTEQGRLFYEGAIKILETISETEAAVADISKNPKGHLIVSSPTILGLSVLAPLIPDFHHEFPDIQIRLRLTDRRVDIIKEGIDLAFHVGELPDSNLKMHKVAALTRVIVASPKYLLTHNEPGNLLDLKQSHDCLLLRFPGSREYYWSFSGADGEIIRLDVRGPFDCDHGQVLTDWALAGKGVANKALWEVKPYLSSGQLKQILSHETPLETDLAVLYPHRRYQEPKIRVFLDTMIPRVRDELQKRIS